MAKAHRLKPVILTLFMENKRLSAKNHVRPRMKEFYLIFLLKFLAISLLFFHAKKIVKRGKLLIDKDGFYYSTRYINTRIDFTEIKQFSIKKTSFGRRIFLRGIFGIKVYNFGFQRRKAMEIHESINFDIELLFELIKKNCGSNSNDIDVFVKNAE